jgi:hypothetical protein
MLEQEVTLGLKLKVGFITEDKYKSNYAGVLPKINEERNPFLHRYVTMRANEDE